MHGSGSGKPGSRTLASTLHQSVGSDGAVAPGGRHHVLTERERQFPLLYTNIIVYLNHPHKSHLQMPLDPNVGVMFPTHDISFGGTYTNFDSQFQSLAQLSLLPALLSSPFPLTFPLPHEQ